MFDGLVVGPCGRCGSKMDMNGSHPIMVVCSNKNCPNDDLTIMKSDLAWCLGKLRGLGHANEDLERKYNLGAYDDEE